MKELGPQLTIILSRMFEMVGEEYSPEKCAYDFWFYAHTWTQATQDLFAEWLAGYVYRNHKECKYEFRRLRKNKKSAKEWADSFTWNYGWKIDG